MNVTPQKEQEYAAHFIAFKYYEEVEEEQVYNVHINKEICKNLADLRKVLLSDSLEVLGIFEDIDDISDIDFKVTDPTIVKIENGKVIPLKIGETDISFRYGYTDYMLHVIVYDTPNPNTQVGGIVAIIATLIISGVVYVYTNRNKKALNI